MRPKRRRAAYGDSTITTAPPVFLMAQRAEWPIRRMRAAATAVRPQVMGFMPGPSTRLQTRANPHIPGR
jgi:hypothetical protein